MPRVERLFILLSIVSKCSHASSYWLSAIVNSSDNLSLFWSYVSTLGDGTKILSSPSYCFSSPPLKKNVTWAYFSVSAILNCVNPFLPNISPNVFVISAFLNAISTFSIVSS